MKNTNQINPNHLALAKRILEGVSNVNSYVTEEDADQWEAIEERYGEEYKELLIAKAY